MDFTEFTSYLVDKMLILVPMLYIIGMVIKNTPKVSDWLIPWILLGLGVLGALAIGLTSGMNVVDAVLQGILATGVTVFANQLIKQTQNKD